MRVNEKRRKNMKKPCLIQETISTDKNKDKRREDWIGKREREEI